MQYALLGDIHSSKEDLVKVLAHISATAPKAKRIGTGDLYECTISKKDITNKKFTRLKDVMLNPEGFSELLDFPSVKGNQEERILLITETEEPLREKLLHIPETIEVGNGEVIHGHQWKWGGEPWALLEAEVNQSLVFYGHSHQSELRIDGTPHEIVFEIEYPIGEREILVNVGSVIGNREWVLYDADREVVVFMQAE